MNDDAPGLGRVGTLPEPMTLHDFARLAARVLPATAQGVRVAGDLDAVVRTVAVSGGSGDSFFDEARASGADVYLTSDLRHHPASEARERAAFDAGQGAATPFLVDVAHFASEWPWLAYAAADIEASSGGTVSTRVSTRVTDPWTAVVHTESKE
jgi:putative NIF3 family GTP cyclohydrolase 1 type 2